MYWADEDWGTIHRANLDGSGVETVLGGLDDPIGIALDVPAGKMYWTEEGSESIRRANLDGSGVEHLVSGLDDPMGIALDLVDGKMYWTDEGTETVGRANLDGSGAETLVTGLDDPVGIAAGRVDENPLSHTSLDYPILGIVWTDEDEDKIQGIVFDAGVSSDAQANPEPSALVLCAVGAAVLVGFAGRRRRG
jgi:hypothetical protein